MWRLAHQKRRSQKEPKRQKIQSLIVRLQAQLK